MGRHDNGWPGRIKVPLLRRYDRNQGERIQLCISTVLVWESGGRLHKMCIGVGWFEVQLDRCLSGNRSQLGTNRHDLCNPGLS